MLNYVLLLLLAWASIASAQGQIVGLTDSTRVKITIKGLFQARYLVSAHKNIDLNGLHHTDGKATYNDFDIKRARLQFAARISDRTDVVLLLNLADFKVDPRTRVLENAFITYRLSPYLNFKMGQFRPAFGLEDMYPVDVIKSLDYSNQYAAFGSNGWQSFQIGASVYGAVAGSLPLKYELSVVNGNNRNQVLDNDNGKHFSSRVELGVQKSRQVKLGLNGGIASVAGQTVHASGIDVSGVLPLAPKWFLVLEAELKQGSNHVLYFAMDSVKRRGNVRQYRMGGGYVLPNLRYVINYHRLSSLEVSCRYEYFDEDFRHGGNPRQTWTPMLSAEFLKGYNGRIQVGANIDRYQTNVSGSTRYNNSTWILQVQSRL